MLFDTMVELPFGLYSDFVLEEKHGFNKKTYKLFVKDLLLTLLLQCVIGGPVLCALIFLVNWGGELFYFYVRYIYILFLKTNLWTLGIRIYRCFQLYHVDCIPRINCASFQ